MSSFEIMIAAAGPAIAGLFATLFALWIKRAMEGRMDALEVDMKAKATCKDVEMVATQMDKKADAAVVIVQQNSMNDKLSSIENSLGGFMSTVSKKLDEGNKVMNGLAVDVAAVKESIKKGG